VISLAGNAILLKIGIQIIAIKGSQQYSNEFTIAYSYNVFGSWFIHPRFAASVCNTDLLNIP